MCCYKILAVHNTLKALRQQLSPVQQYVQAQLVKLRTGSTEEKAEALKGLGRVGGGAAGEGEGDSRGETSFHVLSVWVW